MSAGPNRRKAPRVSPPARAGAESGTSTPGSAHPIADDLVRRYGARVALRYARAQGASVKTPTRAGRWAAVVSVLQARYPETVAKPRARSTAAVREERRRVLEEFFAHPDARLQRVPPPARTPEEVAKVIAGVRRRYETRRPPVVRKRGRRR